MENLENHLKLRSLFDEYATENEKFVASGNKALEQEQERSQWKFQNYVKLGEQKSQEAKNNAQYKETRTY